MHEPRRARRQPPVDVALVHMPYSEVGQPSLALGLLRADCTRHGVASQVVHANMSFSEEIGPAAFDMIFQAYSTTLIGEWTFASALFPDFQPDDERYLNKVVAMFKLDSRSQWRHLQKRYPYLDQVALLREIRRRAPAFVERTAEAILALEPRIVGCSSTFQQHCASLALLREIKHRRPEVVTMIGGANCEGDMGRVTFERFPWLDFVASGEADGFFGALCARLLRSGLAALPRTAVPQGLWAPHHRQEAGAIAAECVNQVDGAPISRLEDMDDSPVPDYDDYFAALSETAALGDWVRPALPFQTARGCWWGEKTHCSFCGISRTAMKFRSKSGDNVIAQMTALKERYGIANFQGTEYIFDYRYFDTLLPRLKDVGGHFRFEVKANLKPEQFQAFVDSGTLEVQPGVESLHDDLLGLLKKGVNARQNILLLKRAQQVGLLVYWNLLYAVPGDRDEWYAEMADLVPLVTHLQSPAGLAQVHYDRFSPYWRDPERWGLELQPAFGYQYVYPLPPDQLRGMAYFFETPRQCEAFYRVHRIEHAGLLRLLEAVKAWKKAWRQGHRLPRLVGEDRGDRIVFEDTRPVAVAPSFEIRGLERRVYLLADDGVRPEHLHRTLASQGEADAPAIDAAVARLIERKLLARVSGSLLALGLASPVPPFLAHTVEVSRNEADPAWARLQADAALDAVRPNIALQCLKHPHDEELSTWLAPTAAATREESFV